MEIYNSMRQFADSWGLLYMTLIFIGVLLYTFRPSAKSYYEEQSRIPLNEEINDHDQTTRH